MAAITPFSHLTTPFVERDNRVTLLGRILQRIDSIKSIKASIENGSVSKNAGIPKSSQPSAESAAEKIISKALKYSTADQDWETDLELIRNGIIPSYLLPEFEFDEVSDEETAGESKTGGRKSEEALWVRRILYATANAEIARLQGTLRQDDTLKLAIHRECQSDEHPLCSLVKAFESVTVSRSRISGIRTALMNVASKSRGPGSTATFVGHISEVERYWLAADAVLRNLDQHPLSDDERKTIMFNAIRGTRLDVLLREYEKNRSAMGHRDEELDIVEMIAHLKHVLRTEETDEVMSRPTNSNSDGIVVGNVNRKKGKGKVKGGDEQTQNGSFKVWFRNHRDTCIKCEQSGHLQSKCPKPLPVNQLSDDNPLKSLQRKGAEGQKESEPRKGKGLYVTAPLAAYHAAATAVPSTDYIVDTGAACVSYLPGLEGFDKRTVVTLESPISVAGIGGAAVVTAVGTVYAKARCETIDGSRVLMFRFDAAVVPSLRASGIALISPQSMVYDGGIHAINYHPNSTDEITLPGEFQVQLGAVGALRDHGYRVEISARYCEARGQNLLPLNLCTQQEIESLVPSAVKSNLLRRGLFAKANA
jgi:hypothetical protein